MTVADLLVLIRRGWRVIAVCVLVGLVVAAGWFALSPRVYAASASGFIAPGNGAAISGTEAAVTRAKSYLPLITSTAVIDRIRNDPEANPGGGPINGRLSARVVEGSNMIVVTATAADPDSALALANGALTALTDVVAEIEAKTNLGGQPSLLVVPFESAAKPTAPISPDAKRIFPAGAAAGLLLGFLLLFIRRAVDVRIRHGDEASEIFGTGVLGWVPKLAGRSKQARTLGPDDVLAKEAIRQIRTGLRFSSVDREVRSFVVTSANQGEGKSTITAAIAQAFAESGQETIVIDADLRRPALSEVFGADHEVGLSEVLSGQIGINDALRSTVTDRLLVLPSGRRPPNPAEMVGSKAFHSLIADLARDHLVIIDAPPVLPVTDAALAATGTDGVVFVVASRQTKRPELAASKQILERVRAVTLGLVINMTSASDGDSYHYSYYNKKYYGRAKNNGQGQGKPTDHAVVLEQASTAKRGGTGKPVAATPPAAAAAPSSTVPQPRAPQPAPAVDQAQTVIRPTAPAPVPGQTAPEPTNGSSYGAGQPYGAGQTNGAGQTYGAATTDGASPGETRPGTSSRPRRAL